MCQSAFSAELVYSRLDELGCATQPAGSTWARSAVCSPVCSPATTAVAEGAAAASEGVAAAAEGATSASDACGCGRRTCDHEGDTDTAARRGAVPSASASLGSSSASPVPHRRTSRALYAHASAVVASAGAANEHADEHAEELDDELDADDGDGMGGAGGAGSSRQRAAAMVELLGWRRCRK